MTVWIDDPVWPAHGTVFAHMVSDTSVDELHALAAAAGIPRRAFDGDHYDVSEQRWQDAVSAGARPTTGADLVRRLIASGLRLRKRKGDRGIARVRGVTFPAVGDGLVDLDLVASSRPLVRHGDDWGAVAIVQDAAGDLAVAWAPRRQEWSNPGGGIEPGESPRDAVVREVAEETGLDVADAVREAGWERFTLRDTGAVRYLHVFTARLATVRPPLRAEHPDLPAPRWLTPDEYRAEFALQPFWPLIDHLLDPERTPA